MPSLLEYCVPLYQVAPAGPVGPTSPFSPAQPVNINGVASIIPAAANATAPFLKTLKGTLLFTSLEAFLFFAMY